MAKSKESQGLSFASVLGLIFIVLKLIGVINWSWWWVLSPFWIGIAIFILVMIFAIIITAIAKR